VPLPLFISAGSALAIAPTGIPAGALGTPTISVLNLVSPTGIPSGAAFGAAALTISLSPTGIPSGGAFGATTMTISLSPVGIPSSAAFGLHYVVSTVVANLVSSAHRPTMAEYRHIGYLTDGWTSVKRWNGRDPLEDAGITGPSQQVGTWAPVPATAGGVTDVGVHLFRYRYLDSRSGYVSNPSEEIELTVAAGAESLTFSLVASGTPTPTRIVRSADPKVDRIILEMSVTDGTAFFKVTEVAQTVATVVVNLTDATIRQLFLPYESFGHDPPPVAKNIVSHRERIWLFSQVIHRVGTATFVNASTVVLAGSTDPEWSTDAMGSLTAPDSDVVWFVRKDGDDQSYEISYFNDGLARLVLTEAYQGVTTANTGYVIFSRANVVWVSNPGFPESFTPLRFINGPNGELAGDITAGVGYGPAMVLFTLSGMHRLSWERGPLVDPDLKPLSNKYGALNQRVVIEVEGVIYALDRSGWQAWDGVFPAHISRSVDGLLASIDFTLADRFHAVFIPPIRAIRWYVCFHGESYPRHYVQLDVDTKTWGTGEHEFGVSESKLVPTANGLEVLLGDENGYLWLGEVGTSEGTVPGESHLTAAAGSTAAIVSVAQTLGTSASGLGGVMAYWVEGAESRQIHRNTANTIELVSAFSAAPAVGDTIWCGSILAKLRTKAFPAPSGPTKVARSRYVWFLFEPVAGERVASVRLYDDYQVQAKTWGRNADRADLPGLKFPADGTADWTMQLGSAATPDGVVRVPTGGDYHRVQEVELVLREPDIDFELYGLEIGASETERLA